MRDFLVIHKALVFRIDAEPYGVFEITPQAILNVTDKKAFGKYITEKTGLKYERFIELFEEELEKGGLIVKPKEADEEVKGSD